ncbi:MAG TPA: hypothetical protein VFT71_06265 [Candidatus Nitrosocosmicus sp.]|nr:hypothetical protein [Candidatus Nitrosocosmicus sp.]
MNQRDIIDHSIKWLLFSDIRVKEGKDQGALYGWKDLTDSSLPFIYSEIVGYAITCYSWIYREKENKLALDAAEEGYQWIRNNLNNNLLPAGKINENNYFVLKGDLQNQIYSFDNGMIIAGLLNLHKINQNSEILNLALIMADELIDKFWKEDRMVALLDASFNQTDYGKGKWSTISGPYHTKIVFGLIKLFKATGNTRYRDISCLLCDFGLKMQDKDGHFITNEDKDLTFLHPHLYSCEGLLYSGIELMENKYFEASLRGLEWTIKLMEANNGLLPRSTKENVEQSDCIAQLLRLLIICKSNLDKMKNLQVEKIIENLKNALARLYVQNGKQMGGVKYQKSFDQVCTWCTMFSLQALNFYYNDKSRDDNPLAMDLMEYYI